MATSSSIKILHYLMPAATLLCFAYTLLHTFIKQSLGKEVRRIQTSALPIGLLLFCLSATSFAQLCVEACTFWDLHHDILPENEFLYAAGSTVVFGAIAVSGYHPWYCYAAVSAIAGLFESLLLVLPNQPTDSRLYMRVAQVTMLLFILILTLAELLPKVAMNDEEQQPLLANGSTSKGKNGSDEDKDTEDEWTRRRKRFDDKRAERMKASGGLWHYIKPYKIFLPYLVPRRSLTNQLCLVVMLGGLVKDRILNVLTPRQVGIVTSKLSIAQNTGNVPWMELLIWLLLRWLPSQCAFGFIESVARNRYDVYLQAQLDTAAMDHVLHLSMNFHDDADAQEIKQAVSQGSGVTDIVEQVAFSLFPALIDLVIAVIYVGHLFGLHVSFVILLSGVAYMYLNLVSVSWGATRQRRLNKLYRESSAANSEAMTGWRTVVYFNRIRHTASEYAAVVYKAVAADLIYYNFRYAMGAATSIVRQSSFAVVILFAAFLVARGRATVGDFVTLVTYWSGIWSPIVNLSSNMRYVSSQFINAERMLMLFQTQASIKDKPDAIPLAISEASVNFRNVSFAYDERRQVLKDIDVQIRGGSSVALVGETGSGKSTILKLLHRFYDPTNGSVEIDGQNIRDVRMDSLREIVGIVPQDTILFNKSILENVRYGRLDATDKDIQEACKAASIHEKILTFPDGYASTVGTRGVKLSGGEQQRVAIARCLLKNPRILLLDEASSAVDSETEARIQAALKDMCKGRTTIAIAHRLSTIANSDLILVMHEGEVVERGTHHELLERSGRYRHLWEMQVAANLDATKKAPEEVLKE